MGHHWGFSAFPRFVLLKPEVLRWADAFFVATQIVHLGVAEWDLESGRIAWSPTLERLYGLPVGSFAGTQEAFLALVCPEDRREVRGAIEHVVEFHVNYEIEFRVLTVRGMIWLRSEGVVLMRGDRPVLFEAVRQIAQEGVW
jgi:PAS domain-containing protein